jgi:hypothetical protein
LGFGVDRNAAFVLTASKARKHSSEADSQLATSPTALKNVSSPIALAVFSAEVFSK